MRNFIGKAGNIGASRVNLVWEKHLMRKLNLSSFLGIVNVCIGSAVFYKLGFTDVASEMLLCLFLAPSVLIANHYGKYVAASYFFTFMGILIFFVLSVRIGMENLPFFYYFPLFIGVTQMLWRKEMFVHLFIQLLLIFFSIIAVLYCYYHHIMASTVFTGSNDAIKLFNILFAFFTSMAFIVIIAFESLKQEHQLETIARQKEVLLAELYHRVKNNLNLVTSLLNLKKNTIESPDGKQALEETRNLVFSMSMIHDKVYGSETRDEILLNEYIHELASDLIKNLSDSNDTVLTTNVEPIVLNISQAIPCGLIVNELITNSYKHGKLNHTTMQITIGLRRVNNMIELTYKDNGSGLKEKDASKSTLGFTLIQSLCDQLDAKANFLPGPGFGFEMVF